MVKFTEPITGLVLLVLFLLLQHQPKLASCSDDYHDEYSMQCKLRAYEFTMVKTDRNGFKCRGTIPTQACYGACASIEYGTFDFPERVTASHVCLHDMKKVQYKTIALEDCDEGADEAIRIYTYPEATVCSCATCDPSTTKCISSETKKKRKWESDSGSTGVAGFLGLIKPYYGRHRVPKEKRYRQNKEQKPLDLLSRTVF